MILRNTVICWVLLVTSSALAADWGQFRGPGGLGVSDEANLPIQWSDGEHLLWKRDLPGAGSSSPIVVDGRIYLTCYSGYGIDRGKRRRSRRLAIACAVPAAQFW